jgi:translation initiation factor 1
MAKKNKKIKLGSSDEGGFVFSTNEDFDYSSEESFDNLSPEEQELTVHLEKKGRGGKTAVVIKNFQGKDSQRADLARALKKFCGVGGSVKDGEIIIQGSVREKVMEYLAKNDYNYKRVGG